MNKFNKILPLRVLIIIPCYNEQLRLRVESFLHFSNKNPNVYFLFVDDGSTDHTSKLLKDLSHEIKNADLLILDKNVGKGEAIRSGVLACKGTLMLYDFIGYIDADLSVPLKEIKNFLITIQEHKNIKFILGARIARLGANINRTASRHYLGRIFATLVSFILKEPVYDSQCGVKLIQNSIAIEIFNDKFISKWFFDVELLIRVKLFNPDYKEMIYEQPLISWTEVSGSKLKFKNFLYAPFELLKIWFVYHKSLNKVSLLKSEFHKKAVKPDSCVTS